MLRVGRREESTQKYTHNTHARTHTHHKQPLDTHIPSSVLHKCLHGVKHTHTLARSLTLRGETAQTRSGRELCGWEGVRINHTGWTIIIH